MLLRHLSQRLNTAVLAATVACAAALSPVMVLCSTHHDDAEARVEFVHEPHACEHEREAPADHEQHTDHEPCDDTAREMLLARIDVNAECVPMSPPQPMYDAWLETAGGVAVTASYRANDRGRAPPPRGVPVPQSVRLNV